MKIGVFAMQRSALFNEDQRLAQAVMAGVVVVDVRHDPSGQTTAFIAIHPDFAEVELRENGTLNVAALPRYDAIIKADGEGEAAVLERTEWRPMERQLIQVSH